MPTQPITQTPAPVPGGAGGVLVTRPEPGAAETARRLQAMGWPAVVAPVLEVATQALRAPGRPQAVLVTSGNALPSLPSGLHGVKLLAVGDATADKARAAGFTDVHSAGRDAEALAGLACALCRPEDGPLLLASGAGQGQALAASLRGRGFRVWRRVVYAAQPAASLPAAASAALASGKLRAVLFFSPQTARVFMTILQRDMPHADMRQIAALAISQAAAAPLRRAAWQSVRVATQPTQDHLLALLT